MHSPTPSSSLPPAFTGKIKSLVQSLALALVIAGAGSGQIATAATYTWDGGGTDGKLSTAANWNPDGAPSATGNILIFAGTLNLPANNDSLTSLATSGTAITFNAGAGSFNLSGNTLTVGSGGGAGQQIIQQSSANAQTISLNLNLSGGSGDRSIVFASGAGSLTLSGNINFSNDWLFPTTTAGTIILSGTNSGDGKLYSAGGITAGTNTMNAMMRNNVAATQLVIGSDTALGNSGSGTASAGTASFRGIVANQQLNLSTSNGVRSLPGSSLAINANNITFNGTSNITLGNVITVGGNRDFVVANTGTVTLSGGIFLSSDQTGRQLFVNLSGTGGMVVNGAVADTFHSSGLNSGTSTLRKASNGMLTLNGNSAYTALTQVDAGTLLVNGTHAPTANSGRYLVFAGATLGGTGTIKPYDTTGSTTSLSLAGITAPGDPSVNGGIGTLTIDGSNSTRSVVSFETGGTLAMQLGAYSTGDKIALIGGQASDIFFNGNAVNFTDTTSGNLAGGQYVLLSADVANAFSGLTKDGNGFITAGLTIGSGLSAYSGSTLQVVGNNIVLNLNAPAPNAPSALTVTSTSGGTAISWTAGTNVGGYIVKRAATSGGPYTTIASGLAVTSYVDRSFTPGTYYYYIVVATSGTGTSANSNEASAAPTSVSGTWTGGTGNYSDTTKWNGGVLASGPGATMTISTVGTITDDTAVSLGSIGATWNSGTSLTLQSSGSGAINFATTSGTPMLNLATYFSRYDYLTNLTITGTQGLNYTGASNALVLQSGMNWSGFSGGLNVVGPGNGDGGMIYAQSANALPATTLSLTPGTGSNGYRHAKLILNSGANQTIGALNSSIISTGTAYISSYSNANLLTGSAPSGTNASGYATLTIGADNGTGVFAGKIGTGYNNGSNAEDATANLLNIIKTGSGTQTFAGTNNYLGTTTVSQGTLLIDGTYNQGTGANAGRIFVSSVATLGGMGTIKLSDTNGGTTGLSISGICAPGDPSTNSGVGTLTIDGSTSARSVASVEAGGTLSFRLNVSNASSKVALINGQANDIFFNGNVVNFTDTTNGGLAAGQYVLVTADVANAYSGLTIDGNGIITAGLTIGSGLSGYASATLQVVGNNILLNLGAPVLPGTPTGVAVSTSGTQATVSWTASANAIGYTIYRSMTPNGTYASIGTATTTSYVDTNAANGVTYYYKVSATNGTVESAASSAVVATPLDPSKTSIIGVNLRVYNTYGMAVSDTAGVARVGYWNNLIGPSLQGDAASLTSITNHLGLPVSGMTVTFTAGKTASGSATSSGMLKLGSDSTTNDAVLYGNVFDQYDTTPGTLSITGIPYSSYDVIFYVYDDGSTRGGSITANGSTYYVRGGAGNPDATGAGYVQSDDTTFGAGTDVVQGDYVRFSGLTGSLTASFVALNVGSSTQRLKIAGFQIISRDPYVAPTSAPDAPSLTASGGNQEVKLNWTASNSATSYKIYKGSSLLATVSSPLLSYADVAVTNGTGYSYTISAVNAVGEGSQSSAASATPAAPSFTPPQSTVYQWSLPMAPIFPAQDGVTYWTYDPQRRAYLWVPPGCTKIQGVTVGLHNMLEKPMFDDPAIRQACADANLAILFIAPGDGTVWTPNGVGNYTALHPSMAINLDPNGYYSQDVVSGTTTYPTTTINGTTYFSTNINPLAGIAGTPFASRTPGSRFANQSEQAGAELASLLTQFATLSGYAEIQYAPVLLTAHSAAGPFCWGRNVPNSAALNGRVFAMLPNKCTTGINLTTADTGTGATMEGIPIMHVAQEWQEIGNWGNMWELTDAAFMRPLRTGSANCLLGECVEPGVGHYEYAPEQAAPLVAFIKATAATRIPANWSGTTYPTLNTIAPSSGWVIDVRYMGSGNCQTVSYANWVAAGNDPLRAYWYPDQTTAQTVCDAANAGFSKKPQMINAFNNSTLTTLAPLGSLNSGGTTGVGYVPFAPTLQSDGVTFQVRAASVNQSPITRLYNGGPLGMASGPIQFRANGSGSMKQTGVDTFRVWLDRESVIKGGQPWEPFILAYHPGDSNYRSAYRPIQILTSVAVNQINGSAQTITFPTLPNVSSTSLPQMTLSGSLGATATSGLPVQYWVASGPYRSSGSNGEILIPDTIPPGTRFPMPVVIGAWQWGHSTAPQVQSATPVQQTCWIFRNGFEKNQYETYGTLSTNANGDPAWNTLPATASATATPYGDNVPNLAKYAFGMNQNASDSSVIQWTGNGTLTQHGLPVLASDGTTSYCVFTRRADYATAGVVYTPQFSTDLVTWANSTDTPTVIATDANFQAVSVPYPAAMAGQPKAFFRVQVATP